MLERTSWNATFFKLEGGGGYIALGTHNLSSIDAILTLSPRPTPTLVLILLAATLPCSCGITCCKISQLTATTRLFVQHTRWHAIWVIILVVPHR